MRKLLLAGVLVALAGCSSSGTSLGSSGKPVDAGAGGAGTGGRGTGGRATGGAPGCSSDVECKGARLCVSGQCVDPPAAGGQQGSGGLPSNGGFGGGVVFGGTAGRAPDASAGAQPGGGCFATGPSLPKPTIVYRDAMVTDTVYTSKPVAFSLMLDRTRSMVTTSNWDNATTAVTAFVNDPRSVGMDVGLGTFPHGPSNTADCSGSDCGVPAVSIAPLPANAAAIMQAMQAQKPSASSPTTTPTECGLRGAINGCLTYMSVSPTGEQCVVVLITDGAPDQCDTNTADLAAIIADGHNKGVTTFTVGLAGADMSSLNAFAAAGGTNTALDASAGAPAFVQALNDIRQIVSVTTVTPVTSPGVVAEAVNCEWTLPPPPPGQTFDPGKVNIEVELQNGAKQAVGYVTTASRCSSVTGNAWYYDDPRNPTRAVLCTNTCSSLANTELTSVHILLGCSTVLAM